MPLRFAFLTLSSTSQLCLFWYQSLASLLLENTGAIRNLCQGKKSMLPQDRYFIGSRGCPEYAEEVKMMSTGPHHHARALSTGRPKSRTGWPTRKLRVTTVMLPSTSVTFLTGIFVFVILRNHYIRGLCTEFLFILDSAMQWGSF